MTAAPQPSGEHQARITRVERRPMSSGPPVQVIELLVRDARFAFEAGQYLEVVHPSGALIPLSIASSPRRLPTLVFHYRSTPGSAAASAMDSILEAGGEVTIRGPAGTVRLSPADPSPLLVVCGGTGAAQALSLLEERSALHAAARPDSPQPPPAWLLGAADAPADFYYANDLQALPGVQHHLLADPARDSGNAALRWLDAHAPELIEQSPRIVLCGSPAFVYAVTDRLKALGASPDAMESDVYAYAPR